MNMSLRTRVTMGPVNPYLFKKQTSNRSQNVIIFAKDDDGPPKPSVGTEKIHIDPKQPHIIPGDTLKKKTNPVIKEIPQMGNKGNKKR